MKSQRTRRASRRSFIVLALSLSSLASVCALAWGVAHSRQAEERRFENKVPEHVPIKVKLRDEKSFKNVENKNSARELEIEIKNTGNKPIHYLYVIIDMPDFLLEDGISLSFRVKYGVNWLAAASSAPPPPDEAPIRPGESITLKIPEMSWKAFEALREKKKKNDPKKIRFELQLIDFGDGTGLESTQGVPFTYPTRQSSLEKPPAGGNADGLIDARDAAFARLRLWQDSNHDGLSQPSEIHTPAALDVVRLRLDYKESKREDEFGNRFRYRAKVEDARGARVGRWAWDVFLLSR